MKCVHCGRENREDTIFCMNCGRPVKREYNRYTCEIYSGDSIVERILSALGNINFNSIKSEEDYNNKKYRTNSHQRRAGHLCRPENPIRQLEQSVQKAVGSAQDVYEEYVEKIRHPEQSQQSTLHMNHSNEAVDDTVETFQIEESERKTGTDWYNEGPEPQQRSVDMAQATGNDTSKTNFIKLALGIITLLIILIPACTNIFINNDAGYEDAVQISAEYQFPENLQFQSFAKDQIAISMPGQSEQTLYQYLTMINLDINTFEDTGETVYSAMDYRIFDEFFNDADEIYAKDSAYTVLGDLAYINSVWQDVQTCLTEEKDYYNDVQLEELLSSFRNELGWFCDSYLE